MPITTMDVWQKFYQSLSEIVAGSLDTNSQVISFAGSTLLIDVANVDPTISNMNIFSCGNVLPAWSPTYTPQGGLLSTYATFLDSINLGGSINPNLQSQINIATAAMNAPSSTAWINSRWVMELCSRGRRPAKRSRASGGTRPGPGTQP